MKKRQPVRRKKPTKRKRETAAERERRLRKRDREEFERTLAEVRRRIRHGAAGAPEGYRLLEAATTRLQAAVAALSDARDHLAGVYPTLRGLAEL